MSKITALATGQLKVIRPICHGGGVVNLGSIRTVTCPEWRNSWTAQRSDRQRQQSHPKGLILSLVQARIEFVSFF